MKIKEGKTYVVRTRVDGLGLAKIACNGQHASTLKVLHDKIFLSHQADLGSILGISRSFMQNFSQRISWYCLIDGLSYNVEKLEYIHQTIKYYLVTS